MTSRSPAARTSSRPWERTGRVRLFDLRTSEHSTIIYETSFLRPLLRLAWNKQDPNYLATVLADDPRTVVLDDGTADSRAELGAHSVGAAASRGRRTAHVIYALLRRLPGFDLGFDRTTQTGG